MPPFQSVKQTFIRSTDRRRWLRQHCTRRRAVVSHARVIILHYTGLEQNTSLSVCSCCDRWEWTTVSVECRPVNNPSFGGPSPTWPVSWPSTLDPDTHLYLTTSWRPLIGTIMFPSKIIALYSHWVQNNYMRLKFKQVW